MKRAFFVFLFLFLVGGASVAYFYRGDLRDWWNARNAPILPEARSYTPPPAPTPSATSASTDDQSSVVEGGVATSQHYMIVSSPPKTPAPAATSTITIQDPFMYAGSLPDQTNLAVPFTSQAPTSDWSLPYQEACEEASSIMVDAYYHGVKGKIDPQVATKEIQDVVAYENKTLGTYFDTSAQDTATFIKGFFGYHNVIVRKLTSVNDIKTVVANGYPVIVPAAGKMLSNPNFRNGGPPYHMLVVKGYTHDQFITNDPGTRLGADYTYSFDVLMHAAHDWNNGSVATGTPVMIVILPNT